MLATVPRFIAHLERARFGCEIVRAMALPHVVIQASINFSRLLMRARIYSDTLPKSLAERLDKGAEIKTGERYSLDVEVDLVRMVAGEMMIIYDAAMTSKTASAETKAMAIVQAKSALDFVTSQVEKAARLRMDRGDSINDEAREQLLDDFIAKAKEALGNDPQFDAALAKARASTSVNGGSSRTIKVKLT